MPSMPVPRCAAVAFFCFFLPLSSSAQQPSTPQLPVVDWPVDASDRFFIENGKQVISNNKRWEDIILMQYVNESYKNHIQNPSEPFDEVQLAQDVNRMRAKYEETKQIAGGDTAVGYRDADEAAASIIGVMSQFDRTRVLSTLGPEIVKWGAKLENYTLGPDSQFQAQLETENQYETFRTYSEGVLRESRLLGAGNSGYDQLFNIIFAQSLGAKVRDSINDLRVSNPTLAAALGINDIQNSMSANQKMNEQMAAVIAGKIDEVRDTQGKLLDAIWAAEVARQKKEAQQEALRKQAEVFQLKMDAAQSSIFIVSTLYSASDPVSAKYIQGIGNATLQIAAALERFEHSANTSTALGGLVLAGSLIGVAEGLGALAEGPQPSSAQIMLEQLAEIRKDIESLRQEMHQRFDVIQAQLVQVQQSLNNNFMNIEVVLNQVNNGVANIQYGIDGLNRQFVDLQMQLQSLFSAEAQRAFDSKAAECFPNRVLKSNTLSVNDGQYGACLQYFYTYATAAARDEISLNQSKVDLDDGELGEELRSHSLAYNMRLLMFLGSDLNSRTLGDKTMGDLFRRANGPVNPITWATGSEAFMRMMVERKDMVSKVSEAYLGDLIEEARRLDAAMRSAILIDDKPNKAFANALMNNYMNRLRDLSKALPALEQSFERQKFAMNPDLKLWKVYNPDTSVESFNMPKMKSCPWVTLPDYMQAELDLPETTVRREWIKPWIIANQLGVQDLGVCYEVVGHPYTYDGNGFHVEGFMTSAFKIHFTFSGKPVMTETRSGTDSSGNAREYIITKTASGQYGVYTCTLQVIWDTSCPQIPNLNGMKDEFADGYPSINVMTCRESASEPKGDESITWVPIALKGFEGARRPGIKKDGGTICDALRKRYRELRMEYKNALIESLLARKVTLDAEASQYINRAFQQLTSAKALIESYLALAVPDSSIREDARKLIFDGEALRSTQNPYFTRDVNAFATRNFRRFINQYSEKVYKPTSTSILVAPTLNRLIVFRDALRHEQEYLAQIPVGRQDESTTTKH